MQNLIICMESFGEISCFCREGKMVFFWSKKGFCFCFLPFQKRLFDSVRLYRCKHLLRYYIVLIQYGEFPFIIL